MQMDRPSPPPDVRLSTSSVGDSTDTSPTLRVLVRIVLPLTLVAIGVVFLIVGRAYYSSPSASSSSPNSVTGIGLMGSMFSSRDALYSGAGIAFIVLAIMVWLLNVLLRMNSSDAGDREEEEQARRYFVEHGRWPDEEERRAD